MLDVVKVKKILEQVYRRGGVCEREQMGTVTDYFDELAHQICQLAEEQCLECSFPPKLKPVMVTAEVGK